MNQAIIIHGMLSRDDYFSAADSPSNTHWLPWLQKELCLKGILAQTPEMPTPFAPVYEEWKREFEKLSPNENTLLVGHSCGGGFIVRWLSEHPDIKVAKVVIIAPWLDVEKRIPSLFNFTINSNINTQTINGFDILFSNDDQASTLSSIDLLKKSTSEIRFHEFTGFRHFTLGSMKTREFPDLLNICLG